MTSLHRRSPGLIPQLCSFNQILIPITILLLSQVSTVSANKRYTECAATFIHGVNISDPNITQWRYTGPVHGLNRSKTLNNTFPLITLAGCEHLCGSAPLYYSWDEISDTLTTWVLPLAGGLILQLPFSSNARLNTFITLCRWLGNPMASLTYILWNVKVLGDCATLVSDSLNREAKVPWTELKGWRNSWTKVKSAFSREFFHRSEPERLEFPMVELGDDAEGVPNGNYRQINNDLEHRQERTDSFAGFRDSMAILAAFNQFRLETTDPATTVQDLEYALFSKRHNLRAQRRYLASYLRGQRKQGVVPVMISMVWFLVALAISIAKAFGNLGENATAHDLGYGLLMSWLPVLSCATIIDRNLTAEDRVKKRLMDLIAYATASRDGDLETYEGTRRVVLTASKLFIRRKHLEEELGLAKFELEPALTSYCGQAREKWHYGIAHSILLHIKAHLRENKQYSTTDAFDDDNFLRDLLTDHPGHRPHKHGDMVLLGDPKAKTTHGSTEEKVDIWRFDMLEMYQAFFSIVVVGLSAYGAFTISFHTPTVGLGCRSGGYLIFVTLALFNLLVDLAGWTPIFDHREAAMSRILHQQQSHNHDNINISRSPSATSKPQARLIPMFWRVVVIRIILTSLELANTCWLIWITLAQTIGIYNNCKCRSTTWGNAGGYTDFATSVQYKQDYAVERWWVRGTIIGTIPLLALVYLVHAWLTQSFLWTRDWQNAMAGLRRARNWKRLVRSQMLHEIFVNEPARLMRGLFDRFQH